MCRFPLMSLLLISSIAFSQNEEKIADLYFEGNEYIMSEEHIEALPIFLELVEMKETANFIYKIGECYLHLPNQKGKAISYLEKAAQYARSAYDPANPNEPHAPLKAMLYLGQAYRINNQIDKAINVFQSLKDSVKGYAREVIDEVNREIEVCENAFLFLESPVTSDSLNFGPSVNDHFSNYNAVITENGEKMYFMNALKFYDAVMETQKENGSWSKADNITMKLKSDGDFYVTDISADGSKLLFYFYNFLSMGDVYESNLIDGKWEGITKLSEAVNSRYHESHATLSKDGETLYFTSNRPGGFGGLDIYSCKLNDSGTWENPNNLGPVINTNRNEDTPFITRDGKKLYFASEGHFNMGEFDVFKSALNKNGKWGKPKNLGYPVNTTDINMFFYPHNNGSTLYVSDFSAEGEGLKDIIKLWNISEPRLRKFHITAQIEMKGLKGKPTDQVQLRILKDNGLFQKISLEDRTWTERFRAGNYTVIASAEGFVADTAMIDLENNQENLDIPIGLLLVPKTLTTKEQPPRTIKIRNIYFDFDSYRISGEDKAYLKKFYRDIEDMDIIVRITGHTDSKGSSAYNQQLSELRANAVKKYLLVQGLSGSGIEVKALGEQKAVAKNQDKNGKDLPGGRRYNRRVELELKGLPSNVNMTRETIIPPDLSIEKH